MRTKPIHKVNAGKPSAHRFFAGPSGLHPDLFAVELEGSDAVTGYLDDDQARELRDEITAFLGKKDGIYQRERALLATNLFTQALDTETTLKQIKRDLRSLGFRYADGTLSRLDQLTGYDEGGA